MPHSIEIRLARSDFFTPPRTVNSTGFRKQNLFRRSRLDERRDEASRCSELQRAGKGGRCARLSPQCPNTLSHPLNVIGVDVSQETSNIFTRIPPPKIRNSDATSECCQVAE